MNFFRWSPLREMSTLRETMGNLVEETIGLVRGGMIPLDVLDTSDEYLITAPLPGAEPADVSISILGTTLHLSGEIPPPLTRSGASWLLRERHTGSFDRQVTLPTPVNAEQAQAEFHNGLLTIRLPKSEQARPQTITIGSTQAP